MLKAFKRKKMVRPSQDRINSNVGFYSFRPVRSTNTLTPVSSVIAESLKTDFAKSTILVIAGLLRSDSGRRKSNSISLMHLLSGKNASKYCSLYGSAGFVFF